MDNIGLMIFFVIILLCIYRVNCHAKKTKMVRITQPVLVKQMDTQPKSASEPYAQTVQQLLCNENKEFCEGGQTPQSRGLFELEQTPQSRGRVPSANQPNHVANLWKCGQSHFSGNSDDREDFANDFVPKRSKSVDMKVSDVSNQHLASRFNTHAS